MKRLVPFLATALLGGGCPPEPTPDASVPATGAIHVYWDFVRTAPARAGGAVTYDGMFRGTVDGPCVQAGVDEVTVDAAGVERARVSCISEGVQGTFLSDLPAGAGIFRVRGWRGALALYEQTFSLFVPPAPDAPASYYLDVVGVPASMELFAALTQGQALFATCAEASNPTIDLELYDSAGTLVLSALGVACAEPASRFAVFSGELDLDSYQVRMRGFTDGVRTFDSCQSSTVTMFDIDHFAAQVGAEGVAVALGMPPACAP